MSGKRILSVGRGHELANALYINAIDIGITFVTFLSLAKNTKSLGLIIVF